MKNLTKALLVLALMLPVVGCSSSSSDSEEKKEETTTSEAAYTAGTYTATANGMGEITVEVTFDDSSITAVELDVSNETASIGQAAKDELTQQVMDAQSAEIDGVSGATITSNAVSEAVQDCIDQAKA